MDRSAAELDQIARELRERWAATAPLWRDEAARRYHGRAIEPMSQGCEDLAAAARDFAAAIRAARAAADSGSP